MVDKNDKIIKELRATEERNRQLEAALKGKQFELAEAVKSAGDSEARIYAGEERQGQLRDTLQLTQNELEKSRKILEILQRDYEKIKLDLISYCQKLGEAEKQLE